MMIPKSRVISPDAIRAGLAEGLTDRQIAERYGFGARHVGDQRRNLGLPATVAGYVYYTDADDALIHSMKAAGATNLQIGKALGRSASSVAGRIAILDLGTQQPGVRGGRGAPIGREATDAAERARAKAACIGHGLDLLRAFGGGTVGQAKARYRARHELNIPQGKPDPALSRPSCNYHSACSSPAGWAS